MLVQGKVKKWYGIIVCLLWLELVHNYNIRMLHNWDSQCFGRMLHCSVQFYHQKNHPVRYGHNIHTMRVLKVVHISGLCDFSKAIAHTCATDCNLKHCLAYQQEFYRTNLRSFQLSISLHNDVPQAFTMILISHLICLPQSAVVQHFNSNL